MLMRLTRVVRKGIPVVRMRMLMRLTVLQTLVLRLEASLQHEIQTQRNVCHFSSTDEMEAVGPLL